MIAVSGNVVQPKPDSHFNLQIDPYISCILIECVCSKMQHKCLEGRAVERGGYPGLLPRGPGQKGARTQTVTNLQVLQDMK